VDADDPATPPIDDSLSASPLEGQGGGESGGGWKIRIGRWGVALALSLAIAWFAAVSGLGMNLLVPFVVDRSLPEGWAAELGEVGGSWLSRIEIDDVEVESPAWSMTVGRLRLGYRVGPLLSRTVEIGLFELESPVLHVTASDTTRTEPTAAAEPSITRMLAGNPVSDWTLRVADLRIDDGRVSMMSPSSEYSVTGARVRGRGGLGASGLTVRLDTLGADFLSVMHSSGDSAFRSVGHFALGLTLEGGRLKLDTLAFTSGHSSVTGSGGMAFSMRPELFDAFDFELSAAPLDLRDLPVVLPEALRAQPEVRLAATGSGSPDSVGVALRGAAFGGRSSVDGRAVLRTDSLPGPALSGFIEVTDVALAAWSLPALDGHASGSVDFELERLAPASAFRVEGRARHEPLNIDPSRLRSQPLQAGFEVSGRASAEGEAGPSPLRANALVRLARIGGPSLGRLAADVEGQRATWNIDLAVDSGRLIGSGTAQWLESMPAASIERMRMEAFDLSAVDTLYPPTRLTGEIEGRLAGGWLADARGRVTLALSPSSLRDVTVDTLRIDSEIRGRRFAGTAFGRSGLGAIEGDYELVMEDSLLRYRTAAFRFARPDSLQPDVAAAELRGSISGTWSLSDDRVGTLDAMLDSARWNSISLANTGVSARLDGERVVADVDSEVIGAAPTPLQLRVEVDVSGAALDDMDGVVELFVQRAHQAAPSTRDSLRVVLEAMGDGSFDLTGVALPGEGGRLSLAGSARAMGDTIRFDFGAEGGFEDPLAVLRGAVLDSISLQLSGLRASDEWDALDGTLTLAEARWRDLTLSRALTTFAYDSTGLRLDTLHVLSNLLEASGGGILPVGQADGRMEVVADLRDLEPIRAMIGADVLGAGGGRLEASAEGSLDSLVWNGVFQAEAIVLNGIRVNGLRVEGEGTVATPSDHEYGLGSTVVDLTMDRVILPEAEVRSIAVNAAGGPDSLRVRAEALVDERRRATALAHVDPRPDRKRVRLEDVRFRVDDDEWALAEQAVLQYRSGVSVEPLLLRARQQELRIEGGISEEGVLDLNARVDSTDISTVADLVGLPRLRGWIGGRVRIQGTTETPEAWVDLGGAVHRANRPPGPVDVRVRANGRSVRGDVRLRDSGSGSMQLVGGARLGGGPAGGETLMGFASDSIDVVLRAEAFNLRWIEAFLTAETLASLNGILEGSLTLVGESQDPNLGGSLRLRDGSARPSGLGVSWDDVSAVVRGDGDRLAVDSVRVAGSGGALVGSGTVGVLGDMDLDLRVSMEDFRAIRTDAYRAVVSGQIDVGGAVRAPEVDGSVTVTSLDVFLDERVTSEGLEPVELTDEDLMMLRERFGVTPDLEPAGRPLEDHLTANVEVVLGRDSWLRKRTSPEMAVPFSGTIQVELRPGEEPFLQGSVEVTQGRGFVEQFGRRFDLTEGTVTFNGPPEATRVDLQATYTVPSHDNPDDAEVTIVLEISGTQDDLGLTLSSDPQMENADIVSYIATGRPASRSLSFENGGAEGGLVAAGADYALSQMTGLIEGAAARSVGLDVIEIRREGLRQATLVAGKYVSPRLYVGFAQPISLQEGDGLSSGADGRSELEIEYEALRWLLINIEGSGSDLRFFLRGRHAY